LTQNQGRTSSGVQVGIGLLERYAGDELAKSLKLR
jgi:hypothetical protein